ncbi:right-handed parallel beta-helix repeat-containing protein [Streptomyces marokkonensis]|uniref:right-handed parallel beta-helix repeat-containing protein n=1 Tax=Streptomyces marokkonensis TaxID=324855 RepID=UPI001FCB7E77|nr:right-handed parallel beta-helix repeat-containing protein [Streptomyces marokkonensis]
MNAVKRGRTKRTVIGMSAAGLLLVTGCEVPGAPAVYRPARPAGGGPFTFYVSPDGDDKNDGMSPEKPWRTLDHADSARLQPGDRLRLRGGERFRGSITLEDGEAGSPARPVVIDSYGDGRATIAPRGTSGITVHNTAGVEIRNLALVGDRRALREGAGIALRNSRTGARRLDHVSITGVDARGFQNGISVGADKDAVSGFSNVRITDTSVHHNLEAGLVFYGPEFDADRPAYANTGLRIDRVKAYSNTGDPRNDRRNTGSGIALGSVKDAKVTRSVAHDNGTRSATDAEEGPEGMWAYDSTRVVFERNRSYRNRTGSRVDGGGFGLDNNVSSSVVQYNLAYQNDGPGFLVYSGKPTGAHKDNVLRFNISWDDARRLPEYGGIVAYGTRMKDLSIYHNTVVMRTDGLASAEAAGQRPPALRLRHGMRDVRVHNNLFATDGGPLVDSQSPYGASVLSLQGNNYHSKGSWLLAWGAERFTTLDEWRTASGQEARSGVPTGSSHDPCLRGLEIPGVGRISAENVVPRCRDTMPVGLGSRALDADPGPVDYFGKRLPKTLTAGAAQPD